MLTNTDRDGIGLIRQLNSTQAGQYLMSILVWKYSLLTEAIMGWHEKCGKSVTELQSMIAAARELKEIITLLDKPETEISKYAAINDNYRS